MEETRKYTNEYIATQIKITIAILLLLGIIGTIYSLIAGAIENKNSTNAAIIETREEFVEAMSTDAGYAFAYGDLITNNPIHTNYGDCIYMEVIKERGGTNSEGEYHWKTASKEKNFADGIKFMSIDLPSDSELSIAFNEVDFVSNGDTRYTYRYTVNNTKGTLYGHFANGTIDKGIFHSGKTIQETKDYIKVKPYRLIIGRWLLLTFIGVIIVVVRYDSLKAKQAKEEKDSNSKNWK